MYRNISNKKLIAIPKKKKKCLSSEDYRIPIETRGFIETICTCMFSGEDVQINDLKKYTMY